MALDNVLKIYDEQGNPVDYDILASDVKFQDGKDLPTKLGELEEEIGEGGYTPPQGGIPKTDLVPAVQTSLDKADTAYQKPASGIPATDIADGVIPDVSGLATKTEVNTGLAGKVDKNGTDSLMTADEHTKLQNLPTNPVTSISVNGQNPQQPVNGNVNIEVQGGSSIDPATATPQMDGTAAVGSSAKYAREDHVHPHDSSKQDALVSGTNIKTVNNVSLLGSGNISIPKGDKGDTGETGPQGPAGPQGPKGDSGVSSADDVVVVDDFNGTPSTITAGQVAVLSADAGKRLNENKLDISDYASDQTMEYDESDCPSSGSEEVAHRGYIKAADGTLVVVTDWHNSGFIAIPDSATKYSYSTDNTSSLCGIAFYSADNESSFVEGHANSEGAITNAAIPTGAKYVRICNKNSFTVSLSISAYQSGQEPFMTEYNGLKTDVADVKDAMSYRVEKKYNEGLCIVADTFCKYTDGSTATGNGWKTTDYIAVPEFAKYLDYKTVFSSYGSSGTSGLCFYNENKVFISGVNNRSDTTGVGVERVPVPAGAKFMRYCIPNTSATLTLTLYVDGVEGFQIAFANMAENSDGNAGSEDRHVLLVSNSFGQDACANIADILANVGVSTMNSIQRFYVSGSTLKGWATGSAADGGAASGASFNNLSLINVFGAGLSGASGSLDDFLTLPWDVVVFQQASKDSDDYLTFKPYLAQLVDKVRTICPNRAVQVKFMMTWETYQSPFADIISATKSMRDNYGLDVIPIGTAVENIRQAYSDAQYKHLSSDGDYYQHLAQGVGEYTAGCALAMALFGDLFGEGLSIYDDDTSVSASGTGSVAVDNTNREKCQHAAAYAIASPFEPVDVSVL